MSGFGTHHDKQYRSRFLKKVRATFHRTTRPSSEEVTIAILGHPMILGWELTSLIQGSDTLYGQKDTIWKEAVSNMKRIIYNLFIEAGFSTGSFLKWWYDVCMEKIGTLFSKKEDTSQYKNISSERSLLIYDFVAGINKTRPCTYLRDGKHKKLGKISPRAVAIKVSHLKETRDLRFLLDKCSASKDFSRTFFGEIK